MMIRNATVDDLPALVSLQKSIEEEGAIWGYRADSVEVWARRDLTWTLVSTAEDRVAGLIYCAPRENTGQSVFRQDSKILEIVELLVAAPYRSRGIGHDLVAAVKRRAVENGFNHLRVYSAAKRFDSVVKFYRSCGFAPWYLEMTQEIRMERSNTADAGEPDS